MTEVFSRNVAGPATHAFIVGVGDYPSAKAGKGQLPKLGDVSDLPSAADGAKFVCDWLIEHRDELVAPLASIEMLVSDPADANDRYEWSHAQVVDTANSANVKAAGGKWRDKFTTPDDIAFFYGCGHGAAYGTEPVLFLSDLGADVGEPWAHHNVGVTAQLFRRLPNVRFSYFFLDACREFIQSFEQAKAQDVSRFAPPIEAAGTDKVALICAASEKLLAYEGNLPGSPVRIGRFTQTMLQCLGGSSSRLEAGDWIVDSFGMIKDMKVMQRVFRPEWRAEPFEPSQVISPNEAVPFIRHQQPKIPVVVSTDPEAEISKFDLRICADQAGGQPWLASCGKGSVASTWLSEVPAGIQPLYAVATNPPAHHTSPFVPLSPVFNQRIAIS